MPLVRGWAGGLFRSAIPTLFKRGYTASRAYSYMVSLTQAKPRRSVFFADWKLHTGVQKSAPAVRFVPKKAYIPKSVVLKGGERQLTPYLYHFKTRVYNTETGLFEIRESSFGWDTRLTKGQAIKEMEEILAVEEEEYLALGLEYGTPHLVAESVWAELYMTRRF